MRCSCACSCLGSCASSSTQVCQAGTQSTCVWSLVIAPPAVQDDVWLLAPTATCCCQTRRGVRSYRHLVQRFPLARAGLHFTYPQDKRRAKELVEGRPLLVGEEGGDA